MTELLELCEGILENPAFESLEDIVVIPKPDKSKRGFIACGHAINDEVFGLVNQGLNVIVGLH
ncbi:MAG: hypothetical protein ACJAT6_001092 [Akkermansiaceae bacterium]